VPLDSLPQDLARCGAAGAWPRNGGGGGRCKHLASLELLRPAGAAAGWLRAHVPRVHVLPTHQKLVPRVRRSRGRCMQHGPLSAAFAADSFARARPSAAASASATPFKLVPDLFRNFDGDRTGVCFLFRYAKPRKKVNNGLSLDLEFAGEFIDADLGCVTHASLGTFLFLRFPELALPRMQRPRR